MIADRGWSRTQPVGIAVPLMIDSAASLLGPLDGCSQIGAFVHTFETIVTRSPGNDRFCYLSSSSHYCSGGRWSEKSRRPRGIGRWRQQETVQPLLNQPTKVTDNHSLSTLRMMASKRLLLRMESTHSLCWAQKG